jgi:hypothetical protein
VNERLTACPNCGRELPPLYGEHPDGPCLGQQARVAYDVTIVRLVDGQRVTSEQRVTAFHLVTHLAAALDEGLVLSLHATRL